MAEILVPVKAAPLGAPNVRLDGPGRPAVPADVRLDPINEVTIAWAVGLRGAGAGASVTAVSIGGGEAETALRSALSRGCTRALRIDPGDGVDPDVASVAALLAAAARDVGATVAAFGYESYDASSGALPAATAAALGWSLVSRARTAAIDRERLEVTRFVGDALEMAEAPLPAVVSFVEGEIPVSPPSLAALLATRRERIPAVEAADLIADRRVESWSGSIDRIVDVPPRSREGRVVGVEDGVRELLALVGGVNER